MERNKAKHQLYTINRTHFPQANFLVQGDNLPNAGQIRTSEETPEGKRHNTQFPFQGAECAKENELLA